MNDREITKLVTDTICALALGGIVAGFIAILLKQ